MTAKRMLHRRSDEEQIAELQAKIESLRQKAQQMARTDQAVLREAPKLHKRLRDFAQLANDNGRGDVANSVVAFIAGLDRMISSPPEPSRRASIRRASDEHSDQGLSAL